ncbi:hypothetical protein QT971_21780 [Microcoleus sp. herbarium19]|uniref:hypothetical protein n=1 Tax=unclassified Microcoleus TaxID=2642155 RepID=UPI002FD16D42
MKKKVVLLVCLLISGGWGGGFGELSIATPAAVDRSNTLSADIPEPAADLSGLVLTSQDLPAGFTEMPADALKNVVGGIPNFKPASVFGYLKNDNQQFQIVTGFTTQLPNKIDRAKFDAEISEDTFAQQFSKGLNSSNQEAQFANVTALTLEDKIGEVSGGWRTQGKIKGVPLNVEVALFRRGKIGSFVSIIYLDGSKPAITISEAARQLDKHIMKLEPDVTQPQ